LVRKEARTPNRSARCRNAIAKTSRAISVDEFSARVHDAEVGCIVVMWPARFVIGRTSADFWTCMVPATRVETISFAAQDSDILHSLMDATVCKKRGLVHGWNPNFQRFN
jgi:hypothetical protein